MDEKVRTFKDWREEDWELGSHGGRELAMKAAYEAGVLEALKWVSSTAVSAYVITLMGGYYSADQGRVRHLSDAQLYSLAEMAQEDIDKMGSSFGNTCRVKPVTVELMQ